MIERVARRLFEARGGESANRLIYGKPRVTWEEALSAAYVQIAPEQCRRDARAAIEAMREPTEAMISAASEEGVSWSEDARSYVRSEFAAMIDAALAEAK